MEPEIINPAPEWNKKMIIMIAVAAILIILAGAYWYFFMQKDTNMPAEVVPVVQKNKISGADFSKLQILRGLMAEAPTDHVLEIEKLRILKSIQTKAPAGTITDTEKLKILQGLAVQ